LSLAWLISSNKHRKELGGIIRVTISIILETFFSIFLAPIKMIYHTWFVITNLFARKLEWGTQARDMEFIPITQAVAGFGLTTLIAVIWGLIAYTVNKSLFLWLLPILLPLILSIPMVIFSSYCQVGLFFKKLGLFLTPVETNPSKEVRRLNELMRGK
jgi:membrane glycosyltransferase